MKALGREHMAFDQVEERHDGEGPVADLVASKLDPLGLKRALWRYMHANLSNRIVASNCGPMKRPDLLAIAALLAYRLDQLEAARDLLQRLGS
ncbi:hypothetical protein [Bradyrhizobium sp. USDA 4451]